MLRNMFPCIGIRETELGHTGPVGLFTLLALSSHGPVDFLCLKIARRLRKAPVGFYCGIVVFTVIILGPSSVSMKLTNP